MSIELVRMVGKRRRELNLSSADVSVLINFIAFMTNRDSLISESVNDLSEYTGRSERTIRNSIQSLKDKNLVFKVFDFSPKEHKSNTHKVNVEALQVSEKGRF